VTDSAIPLSPTRIHGDTVYVSGQLGFDPKTSEIPEDFREEVRFAIESLRANLEAVGASLGTVLKTTVFLTRADDFAAMNDVYRQAFPRPHPARSTVVTGLTLPSLHFEIEAVAHLASGNADPSRGV
jgi:2-iminobutanoate/2-iminopropanoate deaminase